MSGKNRAFALAVATAALVGLSAPVAGAATLQDGPGGFNGDSILNLSNNQLPVQICSIAMPVNEILAQVPLTALSLVVNGTLNSTSLTPTGNQTCDQTSSQANPTTTNTNSSN